MCVRSSETPVAIMARAMVFLDSMNDPVLHRVFDDFNDRVN